jgi:hypothetical protein
MLPGTIINGASPRGKWSTECRYWITVCQILNDHLSGELVTEDLGAGEISGSGRRGFPAFGC